jgi:hypothetical protein
MGDLTGKTALVTGASRASAGHRPTARRRRRPGRGPPRQQPQRRQAAPGHHRARRRAGVRPPRRAWRRRRPPPAVRRPGSRAGSRAGRRAAGHPGQQRRRLGPHPVRAGHPEAFDRGYTVNVRAPFLLIQRALPLLRDGGRIINLSSATIRIASPLSHYAMGKGALAVLATPWRRRWATSHHREHGGPWGDRHRHRRLDAHQHPRSRRRSWRPPPWGGSASPPTSPTWSRSWPATTRVGSPAARSKPAAATGSDRPGTKPN